MVSPPNFRSRTLKDNSEGLPERPVSSGLGSEWDDSDIAESVGSTGGSQEDSETELAISQTGPYSSFTQSKGKGSPFHWLVGAHWLGRWRTPLAVRMWRYGAGSAVAFITSGVVLFVCLGWFHLGAITSTVIAFLAGAVPNWVLNRRWAWEKRGHEGMVKETVLYVVVSVTALAASSAADKFTAVETASMKSHLEKSLLVTFAYLFSVVVLTGLKYLAYDRLVFINRPTSRHQVPTTTEQNRVP
jgi:putative flippase GtrA